MIGILTLRFEAIKLAEVTGDVGRALARQAYTYLDREHGVPFSVTEEDLFKGDKKKKD